MKYRQPSIEPWLLRCRKVISGGNLCEEVQQERANVLVHLEAKDRGAKLFREVWRTDSGHPQQDLRDARRDPQMTVSLHRFLLNVG
ncbi:hypothetical protein WG66_015249 [Moniliophthora roreri]|nr:hypothetical protein WG66_015249 [Moniliophthora roreri]